MAKNAGSKRITKINQWAEMHLIPNNVVRIAEEMCQRPWADIPVEICQTLNETATLVARAGGKLKSRQVIAAIIASTAKACGFAMPSMWPEKQVSLALADRAREIDNKMKRRLKKLKEIAAKEPVGWTNAPRKK